MADFPALPLWTDAYLADTRHLSTLEHGAYLLLLMEAWRRPGCSLPNDDKVLARLAGLSVDEWMVMKDNVLAFWKIDNRSKTVTQKRLSKERDFVVEKRRKNRDAAARRWNKTEKDDANVYANDMPKSSQPTPTPTPTIQKEPSSTSPKKTEKRGSRLPEDFKPDQVWSKAQGMPKEWLVDQFEQFRDYWKSVSGAKGVKLDWDATWRNWVRTAKGRSNGGSQKPESEWATYQRKMTETVERAAGYDRSKPTDDDDSGSTIDLGTADYRSRPSTGSSSR